MKYVRWLVLAFMAFCLSCNGEEQIGVCDISKRHYDWGARYDVRPYLVTASGILVDASGQHVDLELLDRLTDEVVQCLSEEFPDGNLTGVKNGLCKRPYMNTAFYRSCLWVKIPNNWVWSCDGSQQLLADLADPQGCINKGLIPTPECPCRWRALLGVRPHLYVVTTPNFYLYKDPLIKFITGCDNVWNVPQFAKCARYDVILK